MYNLEIIAQARHNNSIDHLPFINKQRDFVKKKLPYKNLKILHNVPMTLSTVFKIEVLARGGAEVVSYISPSFPPEQQAIDLLKKANFKILTTLENSETFDLHLDCCAELRNLAAPKIGAVELTQSGSKIYQCANFNYPLISVDDSELKVLETFLGTGDGFARALHARCGDNKNDKSYVIFGYGKVGKGILHSLLKISQNITVIDLPTSFNFKKTGVKYVAADELAMIKSIIANTYAVITATGKKSLITDYYGFKKNDFANAILINMGAEDEYGANFTEHDIEYAKKPFNFSLAMPTAFRYIDPIFYAHNSAIDLILANKVRTGYNPFPQKIASAIVKEWYELYKEPVDEALLSCLSTETCLY